MLAIITPIEGRGGERPDNSLPENGKPDNSLPSLPNYPDQGLPEGGTIEVPSHPIVLPPAPPENPPAIDNSLPPTVWPGVPVHPATPSHPIALPPGTIWPPLPPAAGNGKAIVIAIIPGVGVRWIVIDLSNTAQPK